MPAYQTATTPTLEFNTPFLALFHDWSRLMINAFGHYNASAYIAYALATKYVHTVFQGANFFPLLHVHGFGPTGKSTVAQALVAPFGGARLIASTLKPTRLAQLIERNPCKALEIDEYAHASGQQLLPQFNDIFHGHHSARCGIILCSQLPITDPTLRRYCLSFELDRVGSTTDAIRELQAFEKQHGSWLADAAAPRLYGYAERFERNTVWLRRNMQPNRQQLLRNMAAIEALVDCWKEEGYSVAFDMPVMRQRLEYSIPITGI
jgi:hypothetical protein